MNIAVVDKILLNFDHTAGLLHSILYTKLFALLLLALSCLGTKGVKGEKKEEVKQIVRDELERIAGDGNLKHLLQNKG